MSSGFSGQTNFSSGPVYVTSTRLKRQSLKFAKIKVIFRFNKSSESLNT